MIYSLKSHSLWDKAGEIKCNWNRLMDVYPYFQEHPDKKLCIILDGDVDKEKFEQQYKMISGVCGDITLVTKDLDLIQEYRSKCNVCLYYGIPDWDSFIDLYEAGLRTFILDGTLAMSLPKVKKYYPDITVRIMPQGSVNKMVDNNGPDMFFIRPEDLSQYEELVDVIDFLETEEKEEALFNIYSRGSYNAPLFLLIQQLSPEYGGVENVCIGKKFGQYRLNCGLKCRTPDSHCRVCFNELKNAAMIEKLVAIPNN